PGGPCAEGPSMPGWFSRSFGRLSKLSRKNRRPGDRGRRPGLALEPLEDRILLTLSSPLDSVLPTGRSPVDVRLGLLDGDNRVDMAVLGADGDLTVALNNGNNTWRSVDTTRVASGPAAGLALGRFGTRGVLDAVVQGADSITLARGDGAGHF